MLNISEISTQLLAKAVDQSLDGISIADARAEGMPLIYVNAGFEKMTGYRSQEVLGKNCRFLQGKETQQPAIEVMRVAIKNGESCIVILQNFRKNGTLFWNEFNISPVFNEDKIVTHFIGVQKDVTARVEMLKHLRLSKEALQNANTQLKVLAMSDGLTGIYNRRHFDEQFQTLFALAQRAQVSLAVLMMDLDFFKRFNDHYGHQAGDDCLILVAGMIADAFKRPSDCAARYGGEEFVVVSMGVTAQEMQQHAQSLCEKIYALGIPHVDSPHHVMSISIGGVAYIPNRNSLPSSFLKQADNALYEAKDRGRNRVHITG